MSKPTLLLTDTDVSFIHQVIAILQNEYQIYYCNNGADALNYAVKYAPDVMLLDLLVPGLDGLSLMYAIERNHIHPAILAVSSMLTDYMVNTARLLKVSYLAQKPCSPEGISDRIRDLAPSTDPDFRMDRFEDYVREQLILLSIPTAHRGYGLLAEAIVCMSRNCDISLTKELYPDIAEKSGGTATQVERNIRKAIESAWDKRNFAHWDLFYPGHRELHARPSNGSVISTLSQTLHRGYQLKMASGEQSVIPALPAEQLAKNQMFPGILEK